jgi:hypothetical protein
MKHSVYFDDQGILVTDSVINIKDFVFVTANVGSVEHRVLEKPNWLQILAACCAVVGFGSYTQHEYIISIILMIMAGFSIGFFHLYLKPNNELIIHTSGMKYVILSSKDKEFVSSVKMAITNAIIDRT